MDIINQIMSFIEGLPVWVTALTGLVVAAKSITILTPSTSDDVVVDKLLRFLNVIALNIGKDKNAE